MGVIGPNGAGKTTLMRVISGLMPLREGAVTLEGQPVGGLPAHRMVEQGIAHVPENRRLFRASERRGQSAHRALTSRRRGDASPSSSPGCTSSFRA